MIIRLIRPITLLLTGLLAFPAASAAAALQLEDCRISASPSFPSLKARCGRFLRPENPEDSNSANIEIRVAVVPALNLQPEPDPIVPLAGGPGQSAIQFYSTYASSFEPLRRDRDILLVDQRGTGESARMDCAVDDELIEGQFSVEQTIEFAKTCLEALPHDPRYFTTSVAVTDLDAIRQALGYETLNLYGVSYGSRVAQHYARRFPQSTRTIVLDGVVPPQLSLGPNIAIEAQKALDNIFARCRENAACNERYPDIAVTFQKLKAKLEKKPVKVKLANPVTGEFDSLSFGRPELAHAVRLLAYHPNTVAILPLLISEAANKNYQPLAAQFQMTISGLSDSIALGMHNAVMCTEDAPFISPELADSETLESSYMGPMQAESLQAICTVWPAGPIDDDFKEPLATDIPTLLLSGSADPITPPLYADIAARNLRKAWLLTGERQGHGQIGVGCMPRILERFISNGGLDLEAGDTECFDKSFVMPFFLDYAGPRP